MRVLLPGFPQAAAHGARCVNFPRGRTLRELDAICDLQRACHGEHSFMPRAAVRRWKRQTDNGLSRGDKPCLSHFVPSNDSMAVSQCRTDDGLERQLGLPPSDQALALAPNSMSQFCRSSRRRPVTQEDCSTTSTVHETGHCSNSAHHAPARTSVTSDPQRRQRSSAQRENQCSDDERHRRPDCVERSSLQVRCGFSCVRERRTVPS